MNSKPGDFFVALVIVTRGRRLSNCIDSMVYAPTLGLQTMIIKGRFKGMLSV